MNPSGLKKQMVLVRDLKGMHHSMNIQNANDMVMHMGWEMIGEAPKDVCDACGGVGKYPIDSQDSCWHCDGDGVDPTK